MSAAAAAHTIEIHKTGVAVITYSQPGINGQTVQYLLKVRDKTTGPLVGNIGAFYGRDQRLATGVGTFTAQNGDTINIELLAKQHIPPQIAGRPGIIAFKVVGGTGAFSSATGSGTITGNVNSGYNFAYSLNGKFHV